MKKDKIFITGATGFIGSHLAERLVKEGYIVRVLTRKTSDLSFLKKLDLEFYEGDLCDKKSLAKALEDVNFVIHSAGLLKAKREADYLKINLLGTRNLLDSILEQKPPLKYLIYFSTIAACGPSLNQIPIRENDKPCPVSLYGKSKLQAEELTLSYQDEIPSIILRLAAIYGPRDKWALSYFKILKKRIAPIFGGKFALCYIEDLKEAVLSIIKNQVSIPSGTIFNIADGNCYSLKNVVEVFERIKQIKTIKFSIPKWLFFFIAYFYETFFKNESILAFDKVKDFSAKCYLVDISKAKKELNFNPNYSLLKGLKETLAWYEREGWL